MRWVLVVGAVVAAGYFAFHYRAGRRAEEALLASVCAQEITDGVLANVEASKQLINKGGSVLDGAGLAYQRKELYAGSSLAPHLAAFRHMGDPSIPHIKELAQVAAARCPEVFPEAVKAEKPIGLVWMLALDLPE